MLVAFRMLTVQSERGRRMGRHVAAMPMRRRRVAAGLKAVFRARHSFRSWGRVAMTNVVSAASAVTDRRMPGASQGRARARSSAAAGAAPRFKAAPDAPSASFGIRREKREPRTRHRVGED